MLLFVALSLNFFSYSHILNQISHTASIYLLPTDFPEIIDEAHILPASKAFFFFVLS